MTPESSHTANLLSWINTLRPPKLHQRVRLEKAHLRPVGGASIRGLYLAGEPSVHLGARVAPTPFLRAAARRAWPGSPVRAFHRQMFLGRGAGGQKQSKWTRSSKKSCLSFFGRRSGGVPLPDGPPGARQRVTWSSLTSARSRALAKSHWRGRAPQPTQRARDVG